jgi:hypothetical protein
MLGRMASARRGSLLARALLCAILLTGTLVACNQSSGGQRVELIAGGGNSDSESGRAASLRLPQKIIALTTARTARSGLRAGRATRPNWSRWRPTVRLTERGSRPRHQHSTAWRYARTAPSFAASGGEAIWRIAGDRLTVAYGKGNSADLGQDLALFTPFIADGKPVTSGNLGRILSVGVDSSGQLLFAEAIDELCYRVLDTVGTVSTVAGRPCRACQQSLPF